MNSTFDEAGRLELLTMDRFFIANQQVFREAWGKLFSPVAANVEDLYGPLKLYEFAVLSGEWSEQSVLETVPLECLIPMVITYRHLSAGEPLYIDGAFVVLWALWEKLDTNSILQCRSCGYRYPGGLPVPIQKCSLCKGTLGPVGCWQGRKAVAAWMN
jgi:hypothetical protein